MREEVVEARIWDLVSRTWVLHILRELSDERPHRFNELFLSLSGISSRTLCDRLNELLEGELVEKMAYAEIPPRVEYFLTVKGRDLCSIICRLNDFASRWERRETRPFRRKR